MIAENQPYVKMSPHPSIPEAPALDILLTDRGGFQHVKLFSLVDTGSDGTAVRWEKMQELQRKLGYDLPRQAVRNPETGEIIYTYEASVIIGDKQLFPDYGIECQGDSLFGPEDALIGRDVLNQLLVMLDGPNKLFTIQAP